MKYFFDTEFIEDGKTIDLLSIGIVAEDGREFYQFNRDAALEHADEWVIYNVYPYLPLAHYRENGWKWTEAEREVGKSWPASALAVSRREIRDRLLRFVNFADSKPEFWAYYADYDWVVLCQTFGRMIDLPKGWPMYCNDVKQLATSKGNPELPKQSEVEHHALNDARWTKQAYEFLITFGEGQ